MIFLLWSQVHARKKPMAEDVDYMAVAGMTDGMVGAELANIVEVAAINMMRDGRSEVGLSLLHDYILGTLLLEIGMCFAASYVDVRSIHLNFFIYIWPATVTLYHQSLFPHRKKPLNVEA